MTERNQYETVTGTEPNTDEQHEPRTVVRTHPDGRLYMMTEIGDGTFVQWDTCHACSKRTNECRCPGGPAEPEFMQRWRDERFTKSFGRRHLPPALPVLLKHRDRRVNAVLRLLRAEGWKLEPPATARDTLSDDTTENERLEGYDAGF